MSKRVVIASHQKRQNTPAATGRKTMFYAAVMADRVKMVRCLRDSDPSEVYRQAWGRDLPHASLVRPLSPVEAEAETALRELLTDREVARTKCLGCGRIWWRWEVSECPSCGTLPGEATAAATRKRKGMVLMVGTLAADDGRPPRWETLNKTMWIEPTAEGCFLLMVAEHPHPGIMRGTTPAALIGADAATVLLTEENSTVFERAYVKAAGEEMRKRLRVFGWLRGF